MELFAFLTTAVTFLSRSNARPLRPLAVPLAAFAGIVLLGVLQLLPLPERLLQVFAPVNASVYHDTREVLALFGSAVPSPRISLAPSETIASLLLVLAVGALFLSAANLLRSRVRRRLFVTVVVLVAVANAGRAILSMADGRPSEASEFAAADLEVALALAFGVVWAEILTGRSRSPRALETSDRIERRILPLAGGLVVWLALGALIAWTGSRAGTVAAGLTCLLLPFVAMAHARAGRRWVACLGTRTRHDRCPHRRLCGDCVGRRRSAAVSGAGFGHSKSVGRGLEEVPCLRLGARSFRGGFCPRPAELAARKSPAAQLRLPRNPGNGRDRRSRIRLRSWPFL